MVSIKLDHKKGNITLGGWEQRHIWNESSKEPIWTPIEDIRPFGGTRGGWVFGMSTLIIGNKTNIFFNSDKTVLRTMLVQEKDIGYNFVTRNRASGEEFVKTIQT
jgi:hypothetical protein